jgi:pyridoxamine 5'-phosphate oxidase
MKHNLANLRKDYSQASLDIADTLSDPLQQFQKWLNEAMEAEVMEVNAMTLSTVNAQGRPSARVVLLKEVQAAGFVFYTNYDSRKGRELEHNPHAALTFFWPELERQVRIEGLVEKVDAPTSDTYFAERPRASQIGAWASPQSDQIYDRGILEIRKKEFEDKFEGRDVPRPKHWGGYVLKPERIEFWQGRPSRLHDRISYTRSSFDGWKKERLAP